VSFLSGAKPVPNDKVRFLKGLAVLKNFWLHYSEENFMEILFSKILFRKAGLLVRKKGAGRFLKIIRMEAEYDRNQLLYDSKK
jgi:hypothetical protein